MGWWSGVINRVRIMSAVESSLVINVFADCPEIKSKGFSSENSFSS